MTSGRLSTLALPVAALVIATALGCGPIAQGFPTPHVTEPQATIAQVVAPTRIPAITSTPSPTDLPTATPSRTPSPAPTVTPAGPVSLLRAHAHNDYQHARPLYDALEHGFVSVEVDIHLVGAELLVAHNEDEVKSDRTLRSLYLDPLRERIRQTGGSVYPSGTQLTLLIDIKSEAEATYEILREILKDYKDILTTFGPNKLAEGPILIIISGNRPRGLMEREAFRYAAYDGRLDDLGSGVPTAFIPLISDKWTTHFTWNGDGPMPDEERQKLRTIVETAHLNGQRVRFWATPDDPSPAREAVWQELITAGVDMINTDDLRGLRLYLLENDPWLLGG